MRSKRVIVAGIVTCLPAVLWHFSSNLDLSHTWIRVLFRLSTLVPCLLLFFFSRRFTDVGLNYWRRLQVAMAIALMSAWMFAGFLTIYNGMIDSSGLHEAETQVVQQRISEGKGTKESWKKIEEQYHTWTLIFTSFVGFIELFVPLTIASLIASIRLKREEITEANNREIGEGDLGLLRPQ